jgi:hypothetical protein
MMSLVRSGFGPGFPRKENTPRKVRCVLGLAAQISAVAVLQYASPLGGCSAVKIMMEGPDLQQANNGLNNGQMMLQPGVNGNANGNLNGNLNVKTPVALFQALKGEALANRLRALGAVAEEHKEFNSIKQLHKFHEEDFTKMRENKGNGPFGLRPMSGTDLLHVSERNPEHLMKFGFAKARSIVIGKVFLKDFVAKLRSNKVPDVEENREIMRLAVVMEETQRESFAVASREENKGEENKGEENEDGQPAQGPQWYVGGWEDRKPVMGGGDTPKKNKLLGPLNERISRAFFDLVRKKNLVQHNGEALTDKDGRVMTQFSGFDGKTLYIMKVEDFKDVTYLWQIRNLNNEYVAEVRKGKTTKRKGPVVDDVKARRLEATGLPRPAPPVDGPVIEDCDIAGTFLDNENGAPLSHQDESGVKESKQTVISQPVNSIVNQPVSYSIVNQPVIHQPVINQPVINQPVNENEFESFEGFLAGFYAELDRLRLEIPATLNDLQAVRKVHESPLETLLASIAETWTTEKFATWRNSLTIGSQDLSEGRKFVADNKILKKLDRADVDDVLLRVRVWALQHGLVDKAASRLGDNEKDILKEFDSWNLDEDLWNLDEDLHRIDPYLELKEYAQNEKEDVETLKSDFAKVLGVEKQNYQFCRYDIKDYLMTRWLEVFTSKPNDLIEAGSNKYKDLATQAVYRDYYSLYKRGGSDDTKLVARLQKLVDHNDDKLPKVWAKIVVEDHNGSVKCDTAKKNSEDLMEVSFMDTALEVMKRCKGKLAEEAAQEWQVYHTYIADNVDGWKRYVDDNEELGPQLYNAETVWKPSVCLVGSAAAGSVSGTCMENSELEWNKGLQKFVAAANTIDETLLPEAVRRVLSTEANAQTGDYSDSALWKKAMAREPVGTTHEWAVRPIKLVFERPELPPLGAEDQLRKDRIKSALEDAVNDKWEGFGGTPPLAESEIAALLPIAIDHWTALEEDLGLSGDKIYKAKEGRKVTAEAIWYLRRAKKLVDVELMKGIVQNLKDAYDGYLEKGKWYTQQEELKNPGAKLSVPCDWKYLEPHQGMLRINEMKAVLNKHYAQGEQKWQEETYEEKCQEVAQNCTHAKPKANTDSTGETDESRLSMFRSWLPNFVEESKSWELRFQKNTK